MKTVVAILDTMWGWNGAERQSTPYFSINPRNVSGRRLHRFAKGANLLVTNSCKELAHSADQHGIPDPFWLQENLELLEKKYGIDVLLVCGKVAQSTYQKTKYSIAPPAASVAKIKFMMHPAARTWTKDELEITEHEVQGLIHG